MGDNAAIFAIAIPNIKQGEGLILTAYPDPLSGGDPWTIGFGATGPHIVPGTVWTEEQAETDLLVRVTDFAAAMDHDMPWWRSLDVVRAAALLEMAYNLGLSGLGGFHNMLQALRSGNFTQAAADALSSRWSQQVGARARRIAVMLRTGASPIPTHQETTV